MDKDERYFIINKMYAGDYLNLGRNIGHEVTNLLSDDNNNNYIYINSSGTIDSKYDDKTIDAIILTKQYTKGCHEILAIAEVDEQILKQSKGDIAKQAEKYNKVNNIKYGKHTLQEIFKDNMYYASEGGKKNHEHIQRDEVASKVTFKTKNFYKPSKHVLLADPTSNREEMRLLKKQGFVVYSFKKYQFGHESPKFYLSSLDSNEKGKKEAYEIVEKIFTDAKNGIIFKNERPERVDEGENIEKRERFKKEATSYLEIMNKISSENIISNLLRYFLDYDRELLKRFCKTTLGIKKDLNYKKAEIKREHHRTDIWIEDDSSIIIIENKIGAGLSGSKQLEKYYVEAKKRRDKCKTELKVEKDIYLFLIAPDYYHKIPDEKLDVGDGHKYKKKNYGEIYEVLNTHRIIRNPNENPDYSQKTQLYYDDFKRAIHVHTYGSDVTKQEAMERRFFHRLDCLDEK